MKHCPHGVLPLHLTGTQYDALRAAIGNARERGEKGELFWSACGDKLERSPNGLHANCASFILLLLKHAGFFPEITLKFFMPDNLKLLMAKHLKQKLGLGDLTLEQCASLYTLKLGEVEGDMSLPPLITSARSLWQQRYAQISHSFHEWSKVYDSRSSVDCFDCYQPMYCKGLYQNIVTQLETKIKNEQQKKAFIIKGASGRGKTAMGKYLAYKTLQDKDSGYEVIQYIDVKTFGELSPEVISKLQTKKCLLIVDNIDQHNCSQSQKLLMNVYKELKKGIILILTKTKIDRSTIGSLSINCLPHAGDIKDLDTAPLKPDESLQLFKASLIQTQSIPIYARRRFGDEEDIILGLFGVEKELIQELPQNPLDILFTAHYIAKAGISLRDYIECYKDLNAGSVSIVKVDIDYQGQIIHERIASYISDTSFDENQLKWLLTIGLIKGDSIPADKFLDGDTSIDFRQQLQDLGIIIHQDSAVKIGCLSQNLILKYLKPKLTDKIIKLVLNKFKDYLEKKLNLKSKEEIEQGQQHARNFINQFWKLGDLDFVDSFHEHGLNTIANWEAFLNGIQYYQDEEKIWRIKLEKARHPEVQKLYFQKISQLDILNIYHLDLSDRGFRQYKEKWVRILPTLVALESLDISGNQIASLDGLPQSIKSLNLSDNQLTSLQGLEKLPALTTLNLSGNSLTSLDGLEKLTKLTNLDISSNKFTTLKGIEEITTLKGLRIIGMNLKNLRGIEKLTSLTSLNVSSNKLRNLRGVEKLINLKELFLNENQLISLKEIARLTKLTILDVVCNRLTSLRGIEKLINLKEIDFYDNQLTSLRGIEKLTSLIYLGLKWNQLTSLRGIKKLTSLTSLNLSSNELRNLSGIEKLTSLTSLNVSSNKLRNLSGIEKLTSLISLNLSSNELRNLSGIEKLIRLKEIDFYDNQLTSLEGITLLQSLQILDLSGNSLTSLEGITLPQSLQSLNLSGNGITSLEGITLPQSLQSLNLSENRLTSLEGITLPQSLHTLSLSRNRLTSLEGITLPQSLQTLDLSHNRLTSLEGITLPQSLQSLDLSFNRLTSLEGITLPQSLQYLDLRRNRLNTKAAGQLLRSLRRHKYLKRLDLGSSINLVDHIPEELTYLFGNTDIKLADGEVIIRFWTSNQEHDNPLHYVSLALPRYKGDGSVDTGQTPLHIGLTPPRDSKDMGRRVIEFAGSYMEDRQFYSSYPERLIRISGLDTKAIIAKYRGDLNNSEKSVDPENLRWARPKVFITNPEEYLGYSHQHDSLSFAYGLLKYGGFDKLLFPAAFEHNPRLKIPMVFNEIKDYLFIYCWQLFTTPQLEAHALQPLFNLAPMELGGISRNQSCLLQSKSFIRGIQSGTFIDSSLKALFRVIEPCMRGTQIILPEVPDSLLLRVMTSPLPLATRPTASQFEHRLLPAPEPTSPQITVDQAAQLIAGGKLDSVELVGIQMLRAKKLAVRLSLERDFSNIDDEDDIDDFLDILTDTVKLRLKTVKRIYQEWLQTQQTG